MFLHKLTPASDGLFQINCVSDEPKICLILFKILQPKFKTNLSKYGITFFGARLSPSEFAVFSIHILKNSSN